MTTQRIAEPIPFKDRSTWLIIVGVLEVVLGIICILFSALTFLSPVFSAPVDHQQAPFSVRIIVLCEYLLISAFFIVSGIGTIRARRWARALMLIAAWFWLIVGVGITFLLGWVLPRLLRQQIDAAAVEASVNPDLPGMVFLFILSLTVLIYVLLPLLLVLFYSGRNVKSTFEWRDPHMDWTDRAPLPVLAAAIIIAIGTPGTIYAAIALHAFPFLGFLLTGVAARAMFLLFSGLWLWIAWGMYKLRRLPYIVSLVLSVETLVTMILILLGKVPDKISSEQISQQDMAFLQNNPFFQGHVIDVFVTVTVVLGLGYFLFLGRYFRRVTPSALKLP